MPIQHGPYLCIPANLVGKDFSSLIPGERDVAGRAEYIFLFIHYLATRTRLAKPEDQEEEENVKDWGFVQIHSDVRRLILGDDYPKIIAGLIAEGIIEPMRYKPSTSSNKADEYKFNMEYYKQGKSCKLYRLRNLSIENRLVCVPITDKPHLLEKRHKIRGNYKSEQDATRMLIKQNVNLLRYNDTGEAVRAMQDYLDSTGQTDTTAEDEILKINCGDADAEFDNFGNRLHAPHTRLKKILRKYLYFEGHENKPLVEIDFRSSQPFLFSNITTNLIKELVPECNAAIPIFEKYEKDKTHRKNLALFRELCHGAKIYPYFIERFREEFDINIQDWQAKQVFCHGFFCDYKKVALWLDKKKERILREALPLYEENGKPNKNFTCLSLWIIRKYFPSIFGINIELKALDWQHLVPGKKDYKQYANNCLLAQRIESAIILERISKDLLDENILFVTIHDSFIVHKNKEHEVKRIIKTNFKKLGIKPPKIKREVLKS